MQSKAIDMSGQRFGRLVVVSRYVSGAKNGGATWLVQCDCGNTRVVARGSLVSGRTRSCGCLSAETAKNNVKHAHQAATKHGGFLGGKASKLYSTWQAVIQRCENPNVSNYKRYGGIGVSICREWRRDFKAFADHIGEPPSKSHSIDRIDPTGNYEPGNVRWATAKEQANNRRNNIRRV